MSSKQNNGTVNIHGKEYKTVALRVAEFRRDHPEWGLETYIVSADADTVVMRAVVADENDRTLASGHAEEKRSSSQINKTSALENCETSAIGRALAAMGYGGTEFASADEVQNAIHQQNAVVSEEQAVTLCDMLGQCDESAQKRFYEWATGNKSGAVPTSDVVMEAANALPASKYDAAVRGLKKSLGSK